VTNVEITACDEEKPKWSFRAKVRIKTGDQRAFHRPPFALKTCRSFTAYASSFFEPPRSRFGFSHANVQRFWRKRFPIF
jgi:hypothetical protein